jgi:type IV pilus assembly protein PilX
MHQSGAVLVVSLIMLLLLTLIGVTAMQSTSLEEKMAGNMRDRSIAFQAAEAALRQGEAIAEAQSKLFPINNGLTGTSCPTVAPLVDNCTCPTACSAAWTSVLVSLGTAAGNAPQYFVEYLGSSFHCSDGGASDPKDCKRYRVTARSNPGTGRANVVLQSVYAAD